MTKRLHDYTMWLVDYGELSSTSAALLLAQFEREHPPTSDTIALELEQLIREINPAADRDVVRQRLIRRLKHPELGGEPQVAGDVHPKAEGYNASITGPVCACCGFSRRSHDVDGERIDCNGYVETK